MTKGSTDTRDRRSLLDWFFRHEEINGGGRCPTYLHRWTLLKLPRGMAIYLHHFVGDDWSRDVHDHPKRFVSIGLAGGYLEYTPGAVRDLELEDRCRLGDTGNSFAYGSVFVDEDGQDYTVTEFVAPWVRTFPAEHTHRITLGGHRDAWTLVLVGWTVRMWGFWNGGVWYPWRTYLGTDHADRRKDCT